MEVINISEKQKSIQEKLTLLKNKRYKFFMSRVYIPGFGSIESLDTKEQVINAYSFVKKQFTQENHSDLSDIGLESIKQLDELYNGYSLEDYQDEFKIKVEQLNDEESIKQLEKLYEQLDELKTREDKLSDLNDILNTLNV